MQSRTMPLMAAHEAASTLLLSASPQLLIRGRVSGGITDRTSMNRPGPGDKAVRP